MKTLIFKTAFILFLAFISFDSYAQLGIGIFNGVQYTKVASGHRFKKHGALNATFEQTGINPDGRIFSPNRKYFLVYQTDGALSEFGKLVLYKSANNEIIWRSGGMGAGSCLMQTDGNLVVYKLSSTLLNPPSDVNPCWSSNTHGNAGAFLAVQDDGNVVIYNAANTRALWATGANGR
jgi:hypothetical protein